MAKVSTVLGVAKSWLGKNEKDGSHKEIIDTYNSHKPLARGYAVKYTDAWCATFVSAVAIKAGATNIIPLECGCGQMIELAKKMGIWIENENRVPNPGEICLYDWDDGTNFKETDNQGWPEHVGYVDSVNASKGKFKVIEGNYSDSVKYRELEINGRYIRGFIGPKYEKEVEPTKPTTPSKPNNEVVEKKTAKDYAQSYNKALSGEYKVTADDGLYMRHGAGTNKKSLTVLEKGTVVRNYGYYTSVNGTKWLYIQVTVKGVQYTGFSSSKYLKKC